MEDSEEKRQPQLMFTDNISVPKGDQGNCSNEHGFYYKNAFHKYIVDGMYKYVCNSLWFANLLSFIVFFFFQFVHKRNYLQ